MPHPTMLSQIAQMFSSQGVVLQGAEFVPLRGREAREGAPAPCDHKSNCGCFVKFDQDSAKLELSPEAHREIAGHKGEKAPGTRELSEDEKKVVRELAKRDQEVRQHEARHMASAGGFAKGGAHYEYQTGPDGKNYAVGGHVSIDAGPVSGNPQATLQKAAAVQRAALAPADPSSQDRAVAAAAAQMAQEARRELARQQETGQGGSPQSRAAAAYAPASGRSGGRFAAYA